MCSKFVSRLEESLQQKKFLQTTCFFNIIIPVSVEGEGEAHARTGHEGPVEEQRYSSTLSLTSELYGIRD
jgi:hypothetical protein